MTFWTGLDQITALQPGKQGTALRAVPSTLSIFNTHFSRFPVLPGVIILGSLGELAARVLEGQGQQRWRMAAAEGVRYRHYVQPGDQMELTIEIKELSTDAATAVGSVKVAGRLVTSARRIRLAPLREGEAQ